jgi:formylmethanofuran dehydrogenase subunit D
MKRGKYEGKYVALDSSCDKVIASGSDFGKVFDKAKKKGMEIPTIVFVPRSDVIYIY